MTARAHPFFGTPLARSSVTMRLAQFILASSKQIVSEWEQFARTCIPAASIDERRDHVAGMLQSIARDLDTPQTTHEQVEKSKGNDDASVESDTAANAHGSDRAAIGYTPVQMVSEFRSLRACVLRLWFQAQSEFNRANLEEVTRFNESIDQLLAESITRYAQAIDNSKDLFLGILGHDLRNPLGAIMTSAALMMRREGPDWHHSKTAARILNSGTRMNAMISDLVDFTRSRLGGGIPINRADMDMEAVCRQTVEELTAFHPNFNVRFEASGPLRGQWDGARIAQVLSNLVGNAFQHGLERRPVDVVVHGEPDEVVLSVHNEGSAIAKGQLESIFDPFRQLDPRRAKSKDLRSVGLGLYIARAIVTAHSGRIDVESTQEGGTTFTVRLPRDSPRSETVGVSREHDSRATSPGC